MHIRCAFLAPLQMGITPPYYNSMLVIGKYTAGHIQATYK